MIGEWIQRATKTGSKGKWHLVESVVDGDAITKCGRRMAAVNAKGQTLQAQPTMPLTRMIGQPQLCDYCDRGS